MQDFKHLYNKEPQVSQWVIIRDAVVFVSFVVAAFAFLLAYSQL